MSDILNFLALVSTTASTKVMIQNLTIVRLCCWEVLLKTKLNIELKSEALNTRMQRIFCAKGYESSVWESDRLASTDLCEVRRTEYECTVSALYVLIRTYIYRFPYKLYDKLSHHKLSALSRVTPLSITSSQLKALSPKKTKSTENICEIHLKFFKFNYNSIIVLQINDTLPELYQLFSLKLIKFSFFQNKCLLFQTMDQLNSIWLSW